MGQKQTESQDQQIVLFEDKDVKITNKMVYIKWYFFPTAGTKKIPISSIKNVEKKDLGFAKGRLWGMDATRWGYWLAGDKSRFSRTDFIGIHVDSSVKPSFTTANIDQVYRILRQLVRESSEASERRSQGGTVKQQSEQSHEQRGGEQGGEKESNEQMTALKTIKAQ